MTTASTSACIDRRRLLRLTAAATVSAPFLGVLAGPAASQGAGELVIANEAEPADLSPWFKGFGHVLVTRQIYETLVETRMTQRDDGTVEIEWVPVLAERWEQVEPTRWRLTLRQGVNFHNGEVFDANAVKASYDALRDDDAAAAAGSSNILRATAGCELVDDTTVDILTAIPDNELLGSMLRLGFVALPPAMLAEQGLEAFSENPVGTGPYRFGSWTRGQEVVLERNEDYCNAEFPATFATIRSFARPEAGVRAQTVASGEADFAFNIGAEQGNALEHAVTGGGFQSPASASTTRSSRPATGTFAWR